jgi:NADH-quinone oxidoreductase subunit E
MLRGGYEILDHCRAKLGIGHKQVTADGVFSLEEVECIGVCCWAPAMQVNYDFHDDLTTVKVDEIIERYRSGQTKGAK